MRQRCNDKNCQSYEDYGARGVKICDEWNNDFLSFQTWANDAAFPGCASETEPSAAVITQMLKRIMKEQVKVVFYIELSNHQLADILAEQTDAETRLFYTCHNVSADDFNAGLTYLDMMKINVESLRMALN